MVRPPQKAVSSGFGASHFGFDGLLPNTESKNNISPPVGLTCAMTLPTGDVPECAATNESQCLSFEKTKRYPNRDTKRLIRSIGLGSTSMLWMNLNGPTRPLTAKRGLSGKINSTGPRGERTWYGCTCASGTCGLNTITGLSLVIIFSSVKLCCLDLFC